jgi:xylose isomerase
MERYGVGLWIFGRLVDRFISPEYKPDKSLDERIKIASTIPLVRGVELSYPSDFQGYSPEAVMDRLRDRNLEISAINIDLFSRPKWQKGSITSLDDSIRRDAIELIKNGIDLARRLNVRDINLWLGQDGHDYLFSNHRDRWRLLIDSLRDVAGHLRNEKLYLEYKHKEPRTHSLISNVGKAVHIIHRVESDKLGVTIDTGHALMADENLAESVYLLADSNIPLMLHLNDCYGYWDDDMIVASINLLKFIEFFYALEDVGYNGWYDLDMYPYREDPVKACGQSLKIIHYIRTVIKENKSKLDEAIKLDDPHKALDMVWNLFLRDFK